MSSSLGAYFDEVKAGLESDRAEWDTPIPFGKSELPPFPVKCLPKEIRDFVAALSETMQTPPEMAGVLSLGVLATALQRRYTVQVRPDWTEPLNLFTVVVAPPAERKSPVLKQMTEPIQAYERRRQLADSARIAENQAERRALQNRLSAAEKAAKDGNMEEVRYLAAKLDAFPTEYPLRLLVDDTTPEMLVELMEQQKGSITVCSAEGGVFKTMRGRYDKGAATLDPYLKGHAGDLLVIDRIGRKGNRVEHPRMTTLLAIQPEVLSGLMENEEFRGVGLCGRFLYALCSSDIGSRKTDPDPIPETVRTAYHDFVTKLLENGMKEEPAVLRFSEGASSLRSAYQWKVEKKLGGEWADMTDWAGKLTGAVCRIAALIHCGMFPEDPAKTPVTDAAFLCASKIGDFLAAHAEAAYGLMGASSAETDAQYILKRITGRESVTRSELVNLCRGRFKRVGELADGLAILEERSYIRTEEREVGYRNRKELVYAVNPALRR